MASRDLGLMTLLPAHQRPAQLAFVAVAVAFAYYLGAQVGIGLTFPPTTTTSVLWPPNSILTAALLLLPVRYWWLCLAGALPVHVLLELDAGFPPYVVALLFVTNSLEALIAAGGLRLLSDAPIEFNSLRRVVAFIGVAGLAAPILSSFADAAVVHTLQGLSYWGTWRVRTYSNVLTELSVVPVAVLGVTAIIRGVRRPSGRRALEAGLLAAGVVASAAWVFGGGVDMPGIPPTPVRAVVAVLFLGGRAVRRRRRERRAVCDRLRRELRDPARSPSVRRPAAGREPHGRAGVSHRHGHSVDVRGRPARRAPRG